MFYISDKQLLKTKIVATLGPEGRDLYDLEGNEKSKVPYRDLFFWLLQKGEKGMRKGNCFMVDVIRLNMSFFPENKGDCQKIFDRFRDHKKMLKNAAILVDLPGAKTRLGTVQHGEQELKKGQCFDLYLARDQYSNEKGVPVLAYGMSMSRLGNYNEISAKLTAALETNSPQGINISIGDGSVVLNAHKEVEGVLNCIVSKGGIIKTKKGVTFHQIDLGLPSFEENDEEALKFILDLDGGEGILAYVAVSFVRKPQDILRVRQFIERQFRKKGYSEEISQLRCPDIIAKIETEEGVNRINAILDTADGAMIARGDLGLQLNLEDVPKVQKDIIGLCNKRGKTAITATEMLASMEDNPKPTRAEVNDVFNAVLDGTDAVMLSGETASGKYPAHAVFYMVNIAKKAELYFEEVFARGSALNGDRMEKLRRDSEHLIEKTKERLEEEIVMLIRENWKWAKEFYEDKLKKNDLQNVTDRVCHACCELTQDKTFKAIIATTLTGRTARMLSRFMPSVPIIAAAHDEVSRRKLLMIRGVYPMNIGEICSKTKKKYSNTEEIFEETCRQSKAEGIISPNDQIVFISGTPLFTRGVVNQSQIKRIPK